MNWHRVMWWMLRWGRIMHRSSRIQWSKEFDNEPDFDPRMDVDQE